MGIDVREYWKERRRYMFGDARFAQIFFLLLFYTERLHEERFMSITFYLQVFCFRDHYTRLINAFIV